MTVKNDIREQVAHLSQVPRTKTGLDGITALLARAALLATITSRF